MRDFEDRVAVVTGAASGIGLALCHRFRELGMQLVMADVEAEALTRAKAELLAAGGDRQRMMVLRTDVTRAESMDALAKLTLDAFGGVHVVCNNAGVFAGGLSWEATPEDWDWVLQVNLWGVIHGLRAFVPAMIDGGEEGHVVNTASMAGFLCLPLSSPYVVSKHAVLALTETLHHELAGHRPRLGVSVLCPEGVATGIDRSERNRPAGMPESAPSAKPATDALHGTVEHGIAPARIADRVVDAIREQRFYVLPPEDDGWRAACRARLDDIRAGRNPELVVPPTATSPGGSRGDT